MLIENEVEDSIDRIVIFRRHLNIELSEDDDEEDNLIEKLEDVIVGKVCKVDYNEKGEDNNVAVRVIVMS